MGIVWGVVAPEARDWFELGKGPWGFHYSSDPDEFKVQTDPSINRLLNDGLHRDNREAFANYVLRVWETGHVAPGHGNYILSVGRGLYDYCAAREWRVELDADQDPKHDYLDWPKVDSRYSRTGPA